MPSHESPSGSGPAVTDLGRIEALFNALAGQPAAMRAEALSGVESRLRQRVESLLAAHDRFVDDDTEGILAAPAPGDRVGAYRLTSRIGTGGMGEVFRAERDDGLFTQQVAIKFMRANVSHPDLLRRFSNERQILASLQHPNIVGLLDGGATADGQAYLIMDYLDGQPLTRYASRRALPLEDRIDVFNAVCAAVQHAHERGVVHRDLKPGNILVGDDGVPKVVDFGIAKLLETAGGSDATRAMLPGPLTPNYASPEQLRGVAVTTASDVYALGVALYELLSGGRPYETDGAPLDRVVQMVVEEEPPPPSASRGGEPLPYARSMLRGDLDAIVLKAMSKTPVDRYSSAAEFAADLERWRAGDPVVARAPSTSYVLRRLALRHRALVGTGLLALVAVLGALGVAAWQWRAATSAQLRAEQRLLDVRQLANSLIFKIHDAVSPLPGSTPVRRTIVHEALQYLARLEEQAAGDPTLRLELAAAHRRLGAILGDPSVPNLGDRPAAIAEYEKARDLIAPLLGHNDDIDLATSVVHNNVVLATLYGARNDGADAVALARETLEYILSFGERHPDNERVAKLIGQARFSLAVVMTGPDAIPEWDRTREHYEGMLAKNPTSAELQRNVALVGKYLGGALETLGELESTRAHYERSLALDEQRLKGAPDNRAIQFDTAISYSNLASVAERLGDLQTAGPLFTRSLELRRMLSETDPENVQAADRYAYLLARVAHFHLSNNDVAAALSSAEQAIARYDVLHRKSNDQISRTGLGSSWRVLGLARKQAGDLPGACTAFTRAQDLYSDKRNGAPAKWKTETAAIERELAACRHPSAAIP